MEPGSGLERHRENKQARVDICVAFAPRTSLIGEVENNSYGDGGDR